MRIVEVNAEPREIDKVVRKFLDVVEKYGKYAIVSGYTSILLGMERPTQDIDIVAEIENLERFEQEIRKGYSIPLTEGEFPKLYEMGEKIDIFTSSQWYFDFKKPSNKWALLSTRNPIKIVRGGLDFLVSPPEIQIPYKLWLGSDKDIKDAAYLHERLKKIIDLEWMKKVAEEMGVDLEMVL